MAARRDAIIVFLATLTGAWAVVSGVALPVLLGAALLLAALGFAAREGALGLLPTHPERAVAMLQGLVLYPLAVVAGTTALIAYVGVNAGGWLMALPDWAVDHARLVTPDGDPSAAAKTASAVVAGAITSLVAFLWSDASAERKSAFWPAGIARAAFERRFGDLWTKLPEGTETEVAAKSLLRAAAREDEVAADVAGWDLPALRARIRIIRQLAPDALPPARKS